MLASRARLITRIFRSADNRGEADRRAEKVQRCSAAGPRRRARVRCVSLPLLGGGRLLARSESNISLPLRSAFKLKIQQPATTNYSAAQQVRRRQRQRRASG